MHQISSDAAQFHLKDGRPLVFHTVPQSLFRRHTGEILFLVMLAAVGLIAATLLAKGRPDPPRSEAARSGAAYAAR
jgi:hypothetical protein